MLLKALCFVALLGCILAADYIVPRYPCDSIEKCEDHFRGYYQTIEIQGQKHCCASDMHLPHTTHDAEGTTQCECIVKYIGWGIDGDKLFPDIETSVFMS